MPTVQVISAVDIELEQVLDSVAKLELPELEQFASEVNRLLARRRTPSLPGREAELIESINRGPSSTHPPEIERHAQQHHSVDQAQRALGAQHAFFHLSRRATQEEFAEPGAAVAPLVADGVDALAEKNDSTHDQQSQHHLF